MNDSMASFKEYLKEPWFAYTIIVLATLVTVPFPSIFSDLVLVVSVFVLSDFTANAIVRGGSGIAQIRPLQGTRTQHEGYVLIAFFISIVITSIIVDFTSQAIASLALSLTSSPIGAIFSALILGFAVYADMRIRFYWRSKTTP